MSTTFAPPSAISKLEAQTRAGLIDDVAYHVRLDLTTSEETYESDTTVEFTCTEPGSTTFVDLVARSVSAIELNGEPIPLDRFVGDRIELTDLTARNTLRVVATCSFERTGVGLHRFVDPADGNVYVYSDFEPYEAHRTYTCFDQPDIKGTFDFEVKAPQEWTVVSCTRASSSPSDGAEGVWVFETTPKMSTYVTAVCAGPWHSVFDEHAGIRLGLFCRQSLAKYLDPEEIFEITKAGFDFFNEEFDFPYVLDTYDHVFCPEYNQGAMENFGCITVAEAYIFRSKVTDTTRERRAETILHEMAHMWFGDFVTMRWWEDLWLNESFATYEAMIAQNAATRFHNGWTTFANNWKTWAYTQDQLPTTHPITTEMLDTDAVRSNFDGISYAKGCSVLRQLVAWVGEKEYREGLRTYFKKFSYGNAELADFLKCLEEASGRDLTEWSTLWLETQGVNILSAKFEAPDGVFTSFSLQQTAQELCPTLRPHRLGVGLYDLDGRSLVRRRVVEADIQGESSSIPSLLGERLADLVLPNDGDLTFSKIRLDDRSLATVTEHIAGLDDSLTRALCWAAVWDMTRDGEMSARRYLQMILDNAPAEDQISVVDGLLLKASAALAFYVHSDHYDAQRLGFGQRAFDIATKMKPRSDAQLSWARAFIGHARGGPLTEKVRGLLDGSFTIEGLQIDLDMQWRLVGALVSRGVADEGLIDEQLSKDATDSGEKQAAAIRASIPTAEAKEKAWSSIVDDTELPSATRRAIIAGFASRDQVELVRPYAERFFDEILPFSKKFNVEVAMSFTAGMFPSAVVEPATVEQTRAFLKANRDMAPHLRRQLLEGLDSMNRALRARDRDTREA